MSALAISLTLAAATAQTLNKKGGKTPDEKSLRFTERLNTELSLDASQKERVQAINLERFKQIEEVKVQAGLDAAGRRQKMKNIDEIYVNNMKGVLSAEQFPKFETLRAEIKEKAFERRQGKK